jgi:hypothetical protein
MTGIFLLSFGIPLSFRCGFGVQQIYNICYIISADYILSPLPTPAVHPAGVKKG